MNRKTNLYLHVSFLQMSSCSSAKSKQSLILSQSQFSGMQRPFGHRKQSGPHTAAVEGIDVAVSMTYSMIIPGLFTNLFKDHYWCVQGLNKDCSQSIKNYSWCAQGIFMVYSNSKNIPCLSLLKDNHFLFMEFLTR